MHADADPEGPDERSVGGTPDAAPQGASDDGAGQPKAAARRPDAAGARATRGPALLGLRALATAVDLVLVALIALVPAGALVALLVGARGPWGLDAFTVAAVALLVLATLALPLVMLIGRDARGTSPGRWLTRVAVVLGDGRCPGPGRGAARVFAQFGGLLLAPLDLRLGVGVVVVVHAAALFDRHGRGLHDRLAGTLVVSRR